MISVEEAIDFVLNSKVEKELITISIDKALNFVLAKDIIAPINIPSFRQSAMDGFAVCGDYGKYKITEEVQAGDVRNISLKDGEACRIFTGAMVPDEASAIIMQEKTKVDSSELTIFDEHIIGKNIRPVGEQISIGNVVFKLGQKLNPAVLGLIQSLGIKDVEVFKLPKISMAVTGNELKTLDSKIKNGEIYESNSITIISAIKQTGFEIEGFTHIVDDYKSTKNSISKLLLDTDVLILSGGISVGDYDFVKQALEENGVEEIFYKVKQKPGKPLFFGKKGEKYVFALPGNPAAALTCFYMYVLPILNKFKGESEIQLNQTTAKLKRSFLKKGDRAQFLKGYLDNNYVEILDGQSSAMLHSYGIANCLIYIPEDKFEIADKEEVLTFRLP